MFELKHVYNKYITNIKILKYGFLLTTSGYWDDVYYKFKNIFCIIHNKNLYIQTKPNGKKYLILDCKYCDVKFIVTAYKSLHTYWKEWILISNDFKPNLKSLKSLENIDSEKDEKQEELQEKILEPKIEKEKEEDLENF